MVPALRSRVLHEGQRGLRLADGAGGDQPPGRLQPRAEHRVRRAANAHAGPGRRGEQATAGRGVQGQGFLVPDTLACRDRRHPHLGVRGRDGQVDHQFHVRVLGGLRHATGSGHAVPGRLGLGPFQVEVRTEQHAQVRERGEVAEVFVADRAAADDGHADGIS